MNKTSWKLEKTKNVGEVLLIGKNVEKPHWGLCVQRTNIVTPECTMHEFTTECFESLQFGTLASMEVKDEDEENEEMRGEMDEIS